MTTPPNSFDDILGCFNILDWLESRITFWLRGRSPLEYRMKFNDDYTLNEVIAHLNKYGVKAVRSGFGSRSMAYTISSRQERWHSRLVSYRDGVPTLYHPKKAWKR